MQSSSLEILTRKLMGFEIPDRAEDIRDILKAVGWKGTGVARLVAALWKKAVGGDVNAAKLIRELNGEGDGSNGSGLAIFGGGGAGCGGSVDGSSGAVNFDVSEMSDEALRAVLEAVDSGFEESECKTLNDAESDITAHAGTEVSAVSSLKVSAADSAGASIGASASVPVEASDSVPLNAADNGKSLSGGGNEKNKKGTYSVPW